MDKIDMEYYKELGLCEVAHTVLISKDEAKFVGHLYGDENGVEDSREFNFLKPSFLKVDFLLKDLIQIWIAQKTLIGLDHVCGPTDDCGIKGIEITLLDSQVTCNEASDLSRRIDVLGSPVVYVAPGLIELQFHDTDNYGPGMIYNLNIAKELNGSIREHCGQNAKFRELLKELTSLVNFDELFMEYKDDDQTED